MSFAAVSPNGTNHRLCSEFFFFLPQLPVWETDDEVEDVVGDVCYDDDDPMPGMAFDFFFASSILSFSSCR